jgi:DNA modification methylase
MQILHGNNLDLLKTLPDNSVDSIVTDPPYGLSFMNKKWDYDVPSVELWQEVYRVLKHGGHVLSFGGTRTYHRMVVNMEDAGFEIRDQIMWLYGSGFPKSLNIGKAIDKIQGNEREVVGEMRAGQTAMGQNSGWNKHENKTEIKITKGGGDWEGWGTALKPANEPICLARKPLSEKSVAENVLKYGTGGINIDGCRVGDSLIKGQKAGAGFNNVKGFGKNTKIGDKIANEYIGEDVIGRFPANVILDEEAGIILDQQSGILNKQGISKTDNKSGWQNQYVGGNEVKPIERKLYLDIGGASRFFYCAKASKSDRGDGNIHPTVKPTELMRYLCRLITPPNGIVLDPFMGSGSTGKGAILEGFDFIGMELDAEYVEIAKARIANAQKEYEEKQSQQKLF